MTMTEIITKRVEAITAQRACNLIEGLDAGEHEFQAMLTRAREPIDNETFVAREIALVHESVAKYHQGKNVQLSA